MTDKPSTATSQDLLTKRFSLNMSRVNRLMNLATRIKSSEDYSQDEVADLNRSIIVFLFASFEDTLRTIEDTYLSPAKNDKKTFGNVNEVVLLLQHLGLDVSNFRPLFPELSTLMRRRHRIVHKADLTQSDAVTDAPWTIGDDYQMVIWFFLVSGFVSKLRATLNPLALAHQWFAEERTELMRKLVVARQNFLSVSPKNSEAMLKSLQNMLIAFNEIKTILNRPNDEIVRAIADKHGIPY